MTRRKFLKRTIATVGFAMAGIFGWSYGVEPRLIRVERVTVAIPSLPTHLQGFTIGVLTDLHLGSIVSTEYIRSAAEKLAAEKPDLVVVAGDLISEDAAAAELPRALEPVKGAFACLGNWDYYQPSIRSQKTVRMLVNAGVQAAPGLWIGGVDDCLLGEPSLEKAFAGAPEGAVRILLAHEPDYADRVAARHRVALQISGHSHGGQVKVPFIGPLLLPPMGRRYVEGLHQAPNCQVYASRGVGVAHLPFRFLCPPEVTILELV
ncbi:MAG TPA: metallophosphoesterase [Symbiobacteriaceae bacterium]|nr:metallophosphoesterase [Symbiobacteriaceae bacterium]